MSLINHNLADRYLLKELIGQGGMADVYLADDLVLNRVVAVKILRSSLTGDPIYIKRFHREATAAAAINHKNIVSIYDVGDEEDLYYIVMEYVKGQTLKELLNKRGALHYIEALDIMKQVVSAVATAHEMGIVHRDLKPQNILITDSGLVKITDFGIASIQSLSQVTQTDTIMGSLHYLAPEIARGEKATPQSDIYALGIVFYELLRGEVPFNGESPVNIALKHMRDEMPSIREFNPSIPQSVENIMLKATAKNVMNRYLNTLDMLDELNVCLDNPNVEKIIFDAPVNEPTILPGGSTEFYTKEKEIKVEEEEPVVETRSQRVSAVKPEETKKKNKTKYIVIVSAIFLALIVALIVFFSSSSNSSYSMPNLVGKTRSAAQTILEQDGVENVKYETQLSDKYDENIIISTNPKAGKEIKKSQSIVIKLSSGKYIVIDNYTGKTYDSVKESLEEKGFTVKKYETTSNEKEGVIIDQSISEGEKIDPNSKNKKITLTVSKGVRITVPYLYGDSVSSATQTLENLGFKVQTEVLSTPTSDEEKAKITSSNINTVVKQSIEPYTTVYKKGTTITLYYYDKVPEVVTSSDTSDNTSNT